MSIEFLNVLAHAYRNGSIAAITAFQLAAFFTFRGQLVATHGNWFILSGRCLMKAAIISFGLILMPMTALAIEKCGSGPRTMCVVDGDTIWMDGEKIRMMGYDTPEPQNNLCGGSQEVKLANQASARLVQLLNQYDISIERHGTDRYDRTLAIVRVAGVNVGDILVQEGLARYWPDGPEFWCN